MTQLKIYEGEVNTSLLNDIIAFVLETAGASHAQREFVKERCLFYDNTANASGLQDKYGFLYLGELLERYESRFGMALPDLRAIALALGYVKDLLTDEMFVGPQRVDFMRKVREGFRGDIYLTAARYLLEDEKDAGLWERILLGTQCAKTEELLFAMSVLPDFAQAERALRPQLSVLLGSGRTVPAIGNMRLFAWLIAHAAPHVKTLRGKDTALFRAICALPASNVKPGSKPYIVLESHGYTPLEIACLNMQAALAPESKLGPDSLVTEKIVVGLFQTALGQPVPLPEEVYPALEWLFRKYSRFRIKCYGCGTLADALKEGARIQEPATFAWFTKLAGIGHPALDGFDILDSKWDSLAGSMDQDKYKGLFERDLHSGLSPEDLTARITRYDQLTGGDYKTACTGEAYSSCFSLLVNNGLVDLWACFQESLDSEGNVKSPDAMDNIRRYLKGISTAQAYRFYEKFFSEYGMPGLKRFWNWEHRDFKESLYRPNYSYYSRSESLHLKRDFLDIDGHRQLLDWLQDYCFCYEPEKYAGLVSEILRDGFAPELLSPAGQALALKLMTTLNRGARDCMVKYRVHACTDVTGFGLLGHACEMAQGSDVSLTLRPGDMDLLPEAAALAREGILPEGIVVKSEGFTEEEVDPGDTPLWRQDLLYDPQTSGGLLIAVDPLDADALLSELAQTVPSAQRIGRAEAYAGGPRIRLR